MAEVTGSFWDHLDELRGVIIRALLVTTLCSVVAFCFGEQLFGFVFAPSLDTFVTYRLINYLSDGLMPQFEVKIINTGLAAQFMIHMKTAFCAGIVCASPYILYEIFRFVSPALYSGERRYASRIVIGGYLMFLAGASLSYLLVFPLTFRFLGTYQVDPAIDNMIDLDSYMSVFLTLALFMGLMFEMPVLAWMFGKAGLINSRFMSHYRRHAIVAILIVAAIITPTSDVFTLLIVSLPIWMLYEVSIWLVRKND